MTATVTSSVECQKGIVTIQQCSVENQNATMVIVLTLLLLNRTLLNSIITLLVLMYDDL